MARRTDGLPEVAEQALRELEKSNQFHDDILDAFDERMAAYQGMLEISSEAAQWTSKPHPPLMNHIVETNVASLVEDRLRFRVTPEPRMYSPAEWASVKKGAEAHEDLHRHQMARDRFNEFQRPHALVAAVLGFAISKTYWRRERGLKRFLENVDVSDRYNLPPGFIFDLQETEREADLFDGPCTECVDPRDFYWDQAATSIDNSSWCADAVWMSLPQVRSYADQGYYEPAAVDMLEAQARGEGSSAGSEVERQREQRGRKNDRVEVLTIWNRDSRRVITLGARKVVLRQKNEWPFWHGRYPFVSCSLQPFPFSIRGMSFVEKLSHLQTMVWDLLGQTIDNTHLINNAIVLLRSDMDDPDSFVYEPGARNLVEDPTQVQMWTPNTALAQVALPHIQLLAQYMQNLAGGQPFTSTSEARNVGADTATEAAIVTNLAQQAATHMKTNLSYAYQRIGQLRMELNQQFIRKPIYVNEIGLDSEAERKEILPYILQGDFRFEIDPVNESLMRAERRSETNALFQIMIQAAPYLSAMGTPINGRAFVEDVLENYDREDKDRYFSAQPQQLPPAGGQSSAQGVPQQPLGGQPPPPIGVTSPLAAGPQSPSSQPSVSPAAMQQRNLALNGGVANT